MGEHVFVLEIGIRIFPSLQAMDLACTYDASTAEETQVMMVYPSPRAAARGSNILILVFNTKLYHCGLRSLPPPALSTVDQFLPQISQVLPPSYLLHRPPLPLYLTPQLPRAPARPSARTPLTISPPVNIKHSKHPPPLPSPPLTSSHHLIPTPAKHHSTLNQPAIPPARQIR